MSYFSSSRLKGLQNCDLSKLEAKEKSRMSRDLLTELGFGNAHTRISIHPPTLTGQSFSALGAMMMKSSSFELIGKLFLMYMLSIFRTFLT